MWPHRAALRTGWGVNGAAALTAAERLPPGGNSLYAAAEEAQQQPSAASPAAAASAPAAPLQAAPQAANVARPPRKITPAKDAPLNPYAGASASMQPAAAAAPAARPFGPASQPARAPPAFRGAQQPRSIPPPSAAGHVLLAFSFAPAPIHAYEIDVVSVQPLRLEDPGKDEKQAKLAREAQRQIRWANRGAFVAASPCNRKVYVAAQTTPAGGPPALPPPKRGGSGVHAASRRSGCARAG